MKMATSENIQPLIKMIHGLEARHYFCSLFLKIIKKYLTAENESRTNVVGANIYIFNKIL
jgi:hypothetical protein